jgi:hypothetical protein
MIDIIIYCTTVILTFVVGFMIGKRYQFTRDQKILDDQTQYLKDTLYSLIAFGVQQGFPFEKIKEIENRSDYSNLTQRESMYLDLKKALDSEQYEEACRIRDKIKEYERGNNN